MIQYHTEFLEFDNSVVLTETLADKIKDVLAESIQKKDCASLVLSGGSTPVQLFGALSRIDLQWHKVFIALVDERWVEISHRDSNEHLVRRYLLKDNAAKARFVGMKTDALTAEAGEIACSKRMGRVPMPFDVLILGMGNDGHTASLFPDAKGFSAAVDMDSGRVCMGIQPRDAPHERMTLTLPAILNSSRIFIHIQGGKKQKVYAKAVSGGSPNEMPIRYVLNQTGVPVTVYWAP